MHNQNKRCLYHIRMARRDRELLLDCFILGARAVRHQDLAQQGCLRHYEHALRACSCCAPMFSAQVPW
jgi:hypothetical protein